MSPPPFPQSYPEEVIPYIDGLATYYPVPLIYDDNILMGEIAYNFLSLQACQTSSQHFSDFLGYSPSPEDTYDATCPFSPVSGSTGYTSSPDNIRDPSPFSPSPTPSRTSSTPEHRQLSLEPPSTPEPSCRQAIPVFSHTREKWCCSVCDKNFRGKWECGRHIEAVGKRAKCVACRRNLSAREDSLLRHFKTYCKGDVENLRFEDAFVEV